MKNPEDRKTIDGEMKGIIWARDNRLCRKCYKVLYKTRKPLEERLVSEHKKAREAEDKEEKEEGDIK